jgi:hypothetical protein
VRIRDLDGTTLFLLLLGLFPVVGFAILGHWPQWEVGAGTAVAVFALRQLALGDDTHGRHHRR